MRSFFKWIFRILTVLFIILFLFGIYAYFRIQMDEPQIEDRSVFDLKRTVVNDSLFTCEKDWLRLDQSGLYELHLSGSPIALGVKNGLLAEELIAYQEQAFVAEIKKKVPSEFYLNFLKYFIGWFNRDMTDYVPEENQIEIYGVSQFTDDAYDFIAPKFQRILNYHGAHDIGHALQNMNLVACTGFGVWGEKSKDRSLIIGRNFDFYVGDQFAEKKIVAFYKPETGHRFMFITWGGLTGVVSGMNDQGLCITLNSAKSAIPTAAYTPVSLVARRILQYSSSIDEAFSEAKKYKTFVSESFLIGSAKDGKAAIIEKTPDTLALFEVSDHQIIATNHYQSDCFKNDALNIENIKESASMYRMQRVQELLAETPQLDFLDIAKILRDQKGLHDSDIGLCNEKAVNQLIAHHSIIFKPQSMQVWVSTQAFQLGKYICYDLNKAFSDSADYKTTIQIDTLQIAADPFLYSEDYKNAQFYRQGVETINTAIQKKQQVDDVFIQKFIASNPRFFDVYKVVGDYYSSINKKEKALETYSKALTCEFPRIIDKKNIEAHITQLKE